MLKKITLAVLALLLSAGLILSIPILNYVLHGSTSKEPRKIADIQIKQIKAPDKLRQIRKKLKRPEHKRPSRTQLKSGPRFAMDLSVTGGSGAAIELDLAKRGQGGKEEEGDVDERPFPEARPNLKLPQKVKENEVNVYALLSFCVNPSGRAYDIKVVEEKPPGTGMANACIDALKNTPFRPARKEGAPVGFCGLEMPFEVKFDD